MAQFSTEPKRAETAQHKLARLKALLEGRSNPDGTPRKGYRRNIDLLRAEIAKLETPK